MIEENNLRSLFMTVDEYAKENFIYPKKSDDEVYYVVYNNGIFYKLGLVVDKGTFFFLNETQEETDYIDYKDMAENKQRTNIDIIKFKLNQLRLVVKELSNIIPEQEIKEEIVKLYKQKK